MSDHLPECRAADHRQMAANAAFLDTTVARAEKLACICDRLRACEARVTERIRTGVTGLTYTSDWRGDVLAVIDATPCPTCNGNGATGRADDPDTCQACRGAGTR